LESEDSFFSLLFFFLFSVKIKTGSYEIYIRFKIWNAILSRRQRWDSGHKQLVAGRNCIPSLSRPAETSPSPMLVRNCPVDSSPPGLFATASYESCTFVGFFPYGLLLLASAGFTVHPHAAWIDDDRGFSVWALVVAKHAATVRN